MTWIKDWNWFERIWIAVFSLVNIYLFFAWGDSLLGLISSLTGMMCVVLVAKGKITNYYFGIINTATYAYISYTYGLYGEAMLNGLFYFPIQFIGLYMWGKSKINKNKSVQGEDVQVNRLNSKQWISLIVTIGISIVAYALFLKYIGGRSVGLDSATNVLSIAAQILMLKRYAEQWILWICVNVLSIIMWFVALVTTGGNDYTILMMWIAYLVNSFYGYINWINIKMKQVI